MTRPRRSLPKDQWPAIDRDLWLAAQAKGGLFEPDGLAARWADATRIQVEKGYAKWLGFLSLGEQLDTATAPGARVSADHLRAYVSWMQDHGLASTTLASRITDLREAIRVMEPGADLTVVEEMRSALQARATPSRNKHSRIMHPDMRPFEAMKLQWHDIETFKTDAGKLATKIFVSGKNKERSLVARDEATHYVFSINERVTEWRHGSVPFIDVLSGPVFVMPDGTQVKSFRKGLKALLDAADLRRVSHPVPWTQVCLMRRA